MRPIRFLIAKNTCRVLPPLLSQSLRNLIYPIKVARQNDFTFTAKSQTGSSLTNRISDSQAYRFSIHGYHEWRNLAISIALCRSGDTIIEIGSHIGTETIGFSDIMGSSGKVYAFEPLPSNLVSLKKTADDSQYKNIIISNNAVGDSVKKVKFVIPLPKESTGLAHILAENEKTTAETIEVDCVTLDSLSIKNAKLIFIDAEGADLSILQGGKNYLKENKPAIVLECYPKFLARSGFTVKDLYSTIKDLGYEAFEISRAGLKQIKSPENYNKVRNWLCIHSSKIDDVKTVDRYIKICGLLPCIPGINPMSKKSVVPQSNGTV